MDSADPIGRKFPPVHSGHPVWYCLIAVSIPLAALIGSALAMRSAWFPPRSGNTYIATVGYGASLHNVSCDVLIDGDSTAMVGVIPEVITRQTGLSSCNIAEFAGMEQVNGRLILDEFLKNNPRPKYIVFVYVPESLSPHDQWTQVSHFEAILFRWRTHPDLALLQTLLSHPKNSSRHGPSDFALLRPLCSTGPCPRTHCLFVPRTSAGCLFQERFCTPA